MTCPDWTLLADRRDLEPEAWDEATVHFDDCSHCRDEALAVEPTLMFRNLPAPKVERGDIEAMKQAVATLRRQSADHDTDTEDLVAAPVASFRRADSRASGLSASAWLRAAAVAAVVVTAGFLQGVIGSSGHLGESTADGSVSAAGSPVLVADAAVADESSGSWLDSLPSLEDIPLIEAVDPDYGSFVQVVDDEISLVLVMPSDV